MENKYFTPDIEDIRVGYEYEYSKTGKEPWHKQKVSRNDWKIDMDNLKKSYRVSFLNKENIGKEGWIQGKMETHFTKGEWNLYWDNKNRIVEFGKGSHPMWINYYYNGECKDINTFRYICKLLGIK